jgi:hypothetical protein
MSHVTAIKAKIKDLDALERALKEFPGAKLVRGKKNFRWYGKWVNDYSAQDAAYKLGIDPKDYGKCDHAIELDGCAYDIGLVQKEDGFMPVYDFWGPGQALSDKFSKDLGKLTQAYGVEKASSLLKSKGCWGLKKTVLPNGTISLKGQLS